MGAESFLTLQIADFAEGVDDRVAALLQAGTGITLTYNDGAGTLTIASTVSPTWGSIGGTLSSQTDLQAALDAKLNLSGGTLTGKLQTPAGDYFNAGLEIGPSTGLYDTSGLVIRHGGQECVQVNNSELSLRSSIVIGWTGTTSATGVVDTAIVRNSGGQVDVRGDSGFRSRNYANNANAPVICSEIDFGFNAGFNRKITPQAYGVLIPNGSSCEGTFTTGNNSLTLNSGVSLGLGTVGGLDASIARVGASYPNANVDIRANNGLRIRNMNNSAFSNLQAQTGTFGEGPSTNGGAWVVDPVNTNLKWDQYGINYLTLQGRADAQSLSFVNPSVAPFVGRGQMDGGNRVGFYFNPTSISVGAVSGYTSTPVTLGVTGRVSASHGTLTASSPALSLTQTWNNAAVAFNAIDVDITNTASAIQSTFATFRRGGTNRIVLYDRYDNVAQGPGVQFGAGIVQEASGGHVALGTTGDPGMVGLTNGMGLSMHPSRYIGWGSTGSATRDQGSAWTDVRINRNGSGPSLQVQAAGGLNVRNLDGSADAPFTAAAITASGVVTCQSGFVLASRTKAAVLASSTAVNSGRFQLSDAGLIGREVYPDGTDWRYASDDSIVT